MASDDADVTCPCNDQFACRGSITEAEMREVQCCLLFFRLYKINWNIIYPLQLLDDDELEKVHSRGLNLAEGQSRSYHCKTPDCRGWCIYEDDVRHVLCATIIVWLFCDR